MTGPIQKFPEVMLVGTRSATTGAITKTAAAASGAYVSGGVFSVVKGRSMTLFVSYKQGAGATNGAGTIILAGTAVVAPLPAGLPLGELWYVPAKLAVADTAETLGGLPTNQVMTKTPGWVSNATKRDLIITDISSADTDVSCIAYGPFDVSGFMQVQILYAEKGDTAHPGSFGISYSLADF